MCVSSFFRFNTDRFSVPFLGLVTSAVFGTGTSSVFGTGRFFTRPVFGTV